MSCPYRVWNDVAHTATTERVEADSTQISQELDPWNRTRRGARQSALCSPLTLQKQHVGSRGWWGRDNSLITSRPPFPLDQVGKSGHSSVEDAQATMELYKLVEVDWEQCLAQNPPKD